MCHQTIRPTPPSHSQAPPPQREQWPDQAAQEEDEEEEENSASNDRQSDAAASVPSEQLQETQNTGNGGTGTAEDELSAESHRKAIQGLCFSPSGDFVGFVSPESCCSPGSIANSDGLVGSGVNMSSQGDKRGPSTSQQPTSSDALSVAASENKSDCNGTLDVSSSSCSSVPPKSEGDCDSCVGTRNSWSNFKATEKNNLPQNPDNVSSGLCNR